MYMVAVNRSTNPWKQTGIDGGPPCVGKHIHCKCFPCLALKEKNIQRNIPLHCMINNIDVFNEMTADEKKAMDENTQKFNRALQFITSKKERSGHFWGILGQPPFVNMGEIDLMDVKDIMRAFIQREKSTEEVIEYLKLSARTQVHPDSDLLTKAILRTIWLWYCPD